MTTGRGSFGLLNVVLLLTVLFGVGLFTLSYALFQTANNTAIMATAQPEQRGLSPACSTCRATSG